MKRFYVTTPLYYVNDRLHLGHAYSTIAADVLARYHRLRGEDVFFLTGTDEHGQKIAEAAASAGVTPQEWADRIVEDDQDLWKRLNISHDEFIRTTEGRHHRAVQQAFRAMREGGDIYPGTYRGPYCVPCETYHLPAEVEGGNCPDCGRPVTEVSEETFYFKLSRFEKPLLKHFEQHPDFLRPAARVAEMVRFIRQGLRDQSISRTQVRWGVPVPDQPGHTVYVWFDALMNYLTAAGYGAGQIPSTWPADVHVVGKEIVRFHTVIWPAMLMALGLPLPRRVFGHGWWTVEGEKMSKSRGNVVDPRAVCDEVGVDAFRYFLLREVPFGSDGDFSRASLRRRYAADLANDLGNLVSRIVPLARRHLGARSPRAPEGDPELRRAAGVLAERMPGWMDELEFHAALSGVWDLVTAANRFIDRAAPWRLTGNGDRSRLGEVVGQVLEVLRLLSIHLAPFMPETAAAIGGVVGQGLSPRDYPAAVRWGGLVEGRELPEAKPLFPKDRVTR